MKKYVSLFLIILCLFTQNVSATTSKNNDTFTIDQNTLDDNQSLSLDIYPIIIIAFSRSHT